MVKILSVVSCLSSVSVALAGEPPQPNLGRPVDYVAWMHVEYGVGGQENAADRYLAACEAFVEDAEGLEAGKKPARFWSSKEKRAAERWGKKNEPALAQLAEGARVRPCYFKCDSDTGALFDVKLSHLAPMRKLAWALAARARQRLMSGDTDGALEDLEVLLRSARHVQKQPFILSYLVGVNMSTFAYDVVLELPAVAAGGADYAAICKKLRRIDRKAPDMSTAIESERAGIYDALQRWSEDTDSDGKIDMWRMPEESYGDHADDVPVIPARSLQELTGKADEHLDARLNAGKRAYSEVLALGTSLDKDKYAWSPIYILMGSFSRAEQVRRSRDARQHAAHMVLYLHAYRAEHGEWPDTLARATGGKLTPMIFDPFSSGELIYRLKNGAPLLYSVGADGKDNKGRQSDGDRLGDGLDLVFWPLPKE